jgi:hypothetical protein
MPQREVRSPDSSRATPGSRRRGAHGVSLVVIAGLWLALFASRAAADDWVRPEPTGFHSRGFFYVAEIFPPQSRQNAGDKPLCYFYAMGYAGSGWKVDARLVWKAPLVNSTGPYQAVLSPEGDLVTLNEHGRVGYDNAVVIYRRDGSLVKAYTLDDLLPAKVISLNENEAKIPISMSSRWWTRDAAYYLLAQPARFYVALPWGSALEFLLENGKVSYAPAAEFPEFAALRRKEAADAARGMFHSTNEEVEVWSTSLRFSSMTDVRAARSGVRP